MKIGLILEGGAMRGMYTAGVLDVFMENKKEIFVIRPTRTINIKRIEKNVNKLQQMYDLGREDCKNILEDLKQFLK